MLDNVLGVALLVGLGWFLTNRGAIEWFFDLIDLGDNLKKARDWVRRQDGWPAAVLGVAFAGLTWGCWELSWRFDIQPTWEYAKWVAAFVASEGADQEKLATVGFVITMMPTLIELTAVGLGRDGVKMVEYLVYIFSGIDIITDWPASSALVDGWMQQGLFNGWRGPVAFAGEYLFKAGWTLMASFGFEMLTVLFGASAIMLFLAAVPDGQGGGRRRGRGRREEVVA